ncbi:glycine receptor subunit alpha-1-like [Rhopilema esculentum]|uniref:glycine receptor subunit alpha-1-like n=1 Tax=Rhopilema esculentum TaxID=499914 RepID=UPI0031E47B0F
MANVNRNQLIHFLLALAFFTSATLASMEKCVKEHPFLPCGYDATSRPNAQNEKSTDISLELYIESFGDVDVEKMEFDVFGYISQTWQDPRLRALNDTPKILQGSHITHLWTPDIYCINCRSYNLENGLNTKQGMIRINRNGTVYMSSGIKLTGSCYMNLRKFPFDMQRCSVILSSYAYNMSHITYTWKNDPFVKIKKMDQFMVDSAKSSLETEQYMSGKFVKAVARFSFKRRFGYYLLQLYVPTAMLVALSWTMFCLDQEHTGDRIAIGVTLFLTMIFLHGYANSSLPKVSYVKMVDLFMVVSLGEILLITIETIIIARLYQWDRHAKEKDEDHCERVSDKSKSKGIFGCLLPKSLKRGPHNQAEMQILTIQETALGASPDDVSPSRGAEKNHNNREGSTDDCEKSMRHEWQMHEIVEKAAMVLLPLSFLLFNAWYWIALFANDS